MLSKVGLDPYKVLCEELTPSFYVDEIAAYVVRKNTKRKWEKI